MTLAHSDLLKAAGLRVTKPRVAVMEALMEQPHADALTVHSKAVVDLPEVSRQAVYDCLNALTDAGVVRRIQPIGSVARYELRVGDNHHHLVCRSCGVIVDVDCAVGQTPCLNAADGQGFEITEAEVNYWGICPDCKSNDAPRKGEQG